MKFPYELPCTVFLRCKKFARVSQRTDAPHSTPFRLLGNLQDEPDLHELGFPPPEAWREDGRWQENGARHDLDIVAVVVGRNAEGIPQVEPLASAAGHKGPQ